MEAPISIHKSVIAATVLSIIIAPSAWAVSFYVELYNECGRLQKEAEDLLRDAGTQFRNGQTEAGCKDVTAAGRKMDTAYEDVKLARVNASKDDGLSSVDHSAIMKWVEAWETNKPKNEAMIQDAWTQNCGSR